MAQTTKIQRITGVYRVRGCTRNGSPKFAVTFSDMTIATIAPDADISYKIDSSEYLGSPVFVTYDGRNRITDVELLCRRCNK